MGFIGWSRRLRIDLETKRSMEIARVLRLPRHRLNFQLMSATLGAKSRERNVRNSEMASTAIRQIGAFYS